MKGLEARRGGGNENTEGQEEACPPVGWGPAWGAPHEAFPSETNLGHCPGRVSPRVRTVRSGPETLTRLRESGLGSGGAGGVDGRVRLGTPQTRGCCVRTFVFQQEGLQPISSAVVTSLCGRISPCLCVGSPVLSCACFGSAVASWAATRRPQG